MTRTVYFIRHGEFPLSRRENMHMLMRPLINGSLTPKGIAEAEACGKSLSGVEFTQCFSSPFARTQETAQIILKNSSMTTPPIVVDQRVRERELESWYDKTILEVFTAVKAEGIPAHAISLLPGDTKGETFKEVTERAHKFFIDELLKATPGTILVMSHGGWIAGVLAGIATNKDFELEGNDIINRIYPTPPNTGLTKIVIEQKPSGKWNINFIAINDQSHLQGVELPE